MFKKLRISIILLTGMTMLTGGIYPLLVTLVARSFFSWHATGSLIVLDDQNSQKKNFSHPTSNRYDWRQSTELIQNDADGRVGSELIGQPFTKPQYFWGRPSATVPFPYNAVASSGSNLSSLHPDLVTNVQSRISRLKSYDSNLNTLPVDLVTSSASGLDPHISPAAAEVQVKRVAAARKMSENEIRTYIRLHTLDRQFGVLGEPRVNVLKLNLVLDHDQRN